MQEKEERMKTNKTKAFVTFSKIHIIRISLYFHHKKALYKYLFLYKHILKKQQPSRLHTIIIQAKKLSIYPKSQIGPLSLYKATTVQEPPNIELLILKYYANYLLDPTGPIIGPVAR